MSTRTTNLRVRVDVDAANAGQLGQAASGVDRFRSSLQSAALPAAAALGAVAALGKGAMTAASDVQQAMGGLDAVFGNNADVVKAWSRDAATSVGLSTKDYATFATVIGASMKAAGVPLDQIAGQTDDMIKLGADLAATYGGTTADAVSALSAAMRGEFDSSEKYAVGLSAASVAAEMAAKGTDKLTGKAFGAARQQAIMAIATRNAAGALGQFGRESDSAAGSAQIASAQFENTKAALGEVLLPVAAKAAEIFAKLARYVSDNAKAFQIIAGVIAAVAATILVANAAVAAWSAAQTIATAASKAWAAGQWLVNAAITANPIVIVIALIVALVAAVVILWKKNEGFRNFVLGMWAAISSAASTAWRIVQSVVVAVVSVLTTIMGAFRSVALAVWAAVTGAARSAGAAISGVWRSVQSAASAVWSAIRAVASAVLGGITGAARSAGTTISAIWRAVASAASGAWSGIRATVSAVVSAITSVVRGLVGTVSAAWHSISSAASAAWSGISSIVRGVVSAISAAFGSLVGIISGIWSRITSAITSAIGGIRSVISGIAEVWDATVGRISAGIDKVSGWISGILGKLGGVASKAASIIPGVGRSLASPVVGGYAIPAGYASPVLGAATMASGTTGGGTTSSNWGARPIIIQGALDPVAVARQVKAILGRDATGNRGVRMGATAGALA